MDNIVKLKKYVALSDYTQGQLAKMMGMTSACLNYKLNNRREIKGDELVRLIKLLGIPPCEAGELLFG